MVEKGVEMSESKITRCIDCPLWDMCMFADPAGDGYGCDPQHETLRDATIRCCHEWMLKQEEGK